mgnify:CR=1 FL=1
MGDEKQPIVIKSNIEIDARIQALMTQRNNALNEGVLLSAQLAMAQAQIAADAKKIAELEERLKAPPPGRLMERS